MLVLIKAKQFWSAYAPRMFTSNVYAQPGHCCTGWANWVVRLR